LKKKSDGTSTPNFLKRGKTGGTESQGSRNLSLKKKLRRGAEGGNVAISATGGVPKEGEKDKV